MGYQVVWEKVSVADRRDPKNVKDGIVFERGAMLPDWVDDFTLHVLTTTGGVKAVETPDRSLQEVDNPPAPVRLQEHVPDPLPPVVQPPVKVKNDDPNRPADSASKADWLAYARKRETDADKKKALNDDVSRAELISTYG